MEIMEPTHKQHLTLELIRDYGSVERMGDEDDIETYWELVRMGYLNNLVLLGGEHEWRFKLTEKAEEYLSNQ